MQTANESLLDEALRHEVGLRRFSNATVRKIIALLNRIDSRLVSEMTGRQVGSAGFTERRLNLLLDRVREILSEGYAVTLRDLETELRDLAGYEGEFQAGALDRSIPISVDIVSPSASQLWAAVNSRPFQGRFLREWGRSLEQSAFRRVRDAVRMGFVEGETTDQIVRRVRGTRQLRYKDGILEISRRDAAAVVRTAITHTSNAARAHLYRQNEDIIKGVQWVSTLDGRTSAVCRGRDGKVYPVGEGPRPPAHMNCRSTTVPVLKSLREMGIPAKDLPEGTRASLNGQVAASETYEGWLRKQPVAFQDDVLGKTKAQLFRKGKLPLDRFTDRPGQEYTIAELRVREAAAFERAGL